MLDGFRNDSRNLHLFLRLGLYLIGNTHVGVVFPLIVHESLIDAITQLADTRRRIEVALLIRCRDESQLYQAAGHRRFSQHQESSLLHALVLTIGSSTRATLYELGEFHALRHVVVLHELKHDIALRRVGVEALIALLIVLLIEDDLVLSLSDGEVVGSTVHTQRIGLQASRDVSLRQGIGMDGDKQVGLVLVGNVGTGVQGDEDVSLAGIYHLHIRTVLLHQLTEGQRHVQVDNLLFGNLAHRTCIMTTMTSVDDQRKTLVGSNTSHCHTYH